MTMALASPYHSVIKQIKGLDGHHSLPTTREGIIKCAKGNGSKYYSVHSTVFFCSDHIPMCRNYTTV